MNVCSILATMLFANFGQSRDQAKNAAFQAEMKEVQLALELFKAQNGRYPAADACATLQGIPPDRFYIANTGVGSCGQVDSIIGDGFVNAFIPALPARSAAANPNCQLEYWVGQDGSWYRLAAKRCHAAETAAQGVQKGDELAVCVYKCSSNNCEDSNIDGNPNFFETYAIYSLGGECRAF